MLKHIKANFALAHQVLLLMQALLCLVRQTICGPSPSQHSPTAPDQQVASVPDPHPRWACLLALADNRIWSQAFLWHSVAHIGIRWTKVASKDDCHHIDGPWKQFKSWGDAQYVTDTSVKNLFIKPRSDDDTYYCQFFTPCSLFCCIAAARVWNILYQQCSVAFWLRRLKPTKPPAIKTQGSKLSQARITRITRLPVSLSKEYCIWILAFDFW